MPVHPPAPTDPAGLVDAWSRAVRNVIDLGRTTRPGDADLPTDCPGWTVHDQVAHVAGAEALAAGEPTPELDVSDLAHVRHDFGALMEKYVQARRGRSLEEVLDELEERLDERLAFFATEEGWETRTVAGPFGPHDVAAAARASARSTSGCTSRTCARRSGAPAASRAPRPPSR